MTDDMDPRPCVARRARSLRAAGRSPADAGDPRGPDLAVPRWSTTGRPRALVQLVGSVRLRHSGQARCVTATHAPRR